MIKAIPEKHKGIQMRSRLEARTAAFLDSQGIEWLYETEGYVLDGLCYLPDFYLPGLGLWLEVKGVMGGADADKITRLVHLSRKPCLVVHPFQSDELLHGRLLRVGLVVPLNFDPPCTEFMSGLGSFSEVVKSAQEAMQIFNDDAGLPYMGGFHLCSECK